MKKVLSLVLVLTMVLGSFSFAFAAVPSDVVGTEYEGAVTRLASLEILEGYTDGTFKPGNTITRAEFAAALVRALGLEDAAKASGGATGFNDVPAGHWATGYINIATKMGYVKGMGDGTFAPSSPITYEQAVTLVVRALGYEPAADARGGYPYGYLVVAAEEGVTDDINGVQGQPAPRGLVAQLLDNSLTVPMMVQVGYGSDTKWVKSGTEGTKEIKILTDKLGIDEIEGRVVANVLTDGKLDDNEITIDVKDDKEKDFKVAEGVDADGFLGLEVVAWEGKDGKIFKIENDTDAKDVMYDAVKTTDKEDVYLIVEDDEYEWSKDAIAYVNNDETKVQDIDANAYGRFVLNDDKEVIFAYLFDIDTEDTGLVTKVSSDEIEFASVGAAGIDIIELDDAEEIYVFNTDLSKASVDDINEDMGIFYWIDGDDNYYIIISDDTLEGTLESVRVRDGRLTVNGSNVVWDAEAIYSDDEGKNYNDYDKTVDADVEAIESLIKEDVTVYKNLVGKAMVLTTGAKVTSDTIYGLVTWITDGRYPVMSVYTNEGKEVDYKFAKTDLVDDVRDGILGVNNTNWTTGDFGAIAFEIDKDGEVSKVIDVKKANDAVDVTKDDGDKYVTINSKSYYLNSRSVVIKAVDDNNAKVRPSLIKYDDIIGKDITEDANKPSANNAIMLEAGREVGLLVFIDKDFRAVDTTKYGIVVSDISANKDGDYIADIDVAGEGKDEYVMADKTAKKGDLIEFKINSDGEVEVDASSIINAKNVSKSQMQDVTDKYKNTLTIGGVEYVVTDDTLFYDVDEDGYLEKSRKLTNVGAGKDTVIFSTGGANNDELKVVIITTEMKANSGTTTGRGDFELDNATINTVSGNKHTDVTLSVYVANWDGVSDFEVEIDDKSLVTVKEDTDKSNELRGSYGASYANGNVTITLVFEELVYSGEHINLEAGAIKITAKDSNNDTVSIKSQAGEIKVEQ